MMMEKIEYKKTQKNRFSPRTKTRAIKQFNVICLTTSTAIISDGSFPSALSFVYLLLPIVVHLISRHIFFFYYSLPVMDGEAFRCCQDKDSCESAHKNVFIDSTPYKKKCFTCCRFFILNFSLRTLHIAMCLAIKQKFIAGNTRAVNFGRVINAF